MAIKMQMKRYFFLFKKVGHPQNDKNEKRPAGVVHILYM